jgi:hypothetical protein
MQRSLLAEEIGLAAAFRGTSASAEPPNDKQNNPDQTQNGLGIAKVHRRELQGFFTSNTTKFSMNEVQTNCVRYITVLICCQCNREKSCT